MKLSQVISRSTLAAIAILNVSLATSVNAETIRVTRGPNGATQIVKANNVPVDAQQQPTSAAHEFPTLVNRGPGGAFHIVNDAPVSTKPVATQGNHNLITRGPNGAGFLTNQ